MLTLSFVEFDRSLSSVHLARRWQPVSAAVRCRRREGDWARTGPKQLARAVCMLSGGRSAS